MSKKVVLNEDGTTKAYVNNKVDGIFWSTEQRRIDDLVPYEHNPRQLTDKQKKALTKSLKKFNLVEIPAINVDGMILAGHQRLSILQELGRGAELIDVRVPNRQLTDKEVQEYNIRSNKNTGEWDFDILANNFEVDDLKAWGFTDEDFQLQEGRGKTEIVEDEAPDPTAEPKSKLGDLYQLGDHRLLCGDSTKQEDVERLMNGKRANLLVTDPPYGVSYADKNKFLNSISPGNRNQTEIENDHQSPDDMKVFWLNTFNMVFKYLQDNASYYITSPQGGELLLLLQSLYEVGYPSRHMIIWSKNNHVLGRCDYNYKHEPILYGWMDKHHFYGYGKQKTSVWQIDKPHSSKEHPTMKPVELFAECILNSSDKGSIVFDPFLGSGTTLVAAEQTGRTCYGIEISTQYCDVIIQRWENLTGNRAVLIENGAKVDAETVSE